MAWYNNIFGRAPVDAEEKLNPAQQYIGVDKTGSREDTFSYEKFYEELEIVNRGVNMLVDDAAAIPVVVSPYNKVAGVRKGIKRSKVDLLLNKEPNPYQDISSCLLYTSPSPRDGLLSRMPSSA